MTFSLKTDVNVPSESNKQNKSEKNNFFLSILEVTDEIRAGSGRGSVNQVYGSKDLDPDAYPKKCHAPYLVKKLGMIIEEAHGAAPREPLLNNMQHLGVLNPHSHGQVPDQQIQELRAPPRAQVGVAQPVVVADVLLDLGGEVAAQGQHVLHGAGGGQLVQQESAKKRRDIK
jgi:hypothetical protein